MMTEPTSKTVRSVSQALVAGLLSALVAALILGLQPLHSPLYWWHAAVGDLINTWQAVPDEQLFLFTVDTDQPWVYDSWLSSAILAWLDGAGGAELSLLARNVLCALALGIAAYILARRHRLMRTIIGGLLAAIAVIAIFADTGPAALAAVPAAVGVAAAVTIIEQRRRLIVAALIPAAAFAAVNLDFATAMAIAMIGAVAAISVLRQRGDDDGISSLLCAAIAASALLAPFGFAYGPGALAATITAAYGAPAGLWTAPVVVPVVAVAISVFAITRYTADDEAWSTPARIAMIVLSAASTLLAPSTAAVFGFVVAFAIAGPLDVALDANGDEPSTASPGPLAIIVAVIVAGGLAVIVQPGVDTRAPILNTVHGDLRTEAPHPGTMPADLPLRCLEDLREVSSQLRIYHEPDHAGFVLYHLLDAEQPRPLNFDDHRHLVDDQLRDQATVLRQQPAARGLFTDREINAAVIDRRQYRQVADELHEAPGWHDLRKDRDEAFACFVSVD